MIDVIETVLVSAGDYDIGDNTVITSRPAHRVAMTAFEMGKTAVTNAQFAQFFAARGYDEARFWTNHGQRWLKSKPNPLMPPFWGDQRFDDPLQPIVGVTWYEAIAFSRWYSEYTNQVWRLPTEVEYEAAARGPANHIWAGGDSNKVNSAERGVYAPLRADDSLNVAWCGALHLSGNVYEWCQTRWGHNWQSLDYRYPYHHDDDREDLEGGHARVIRGGSWFDSLREARTWYRARFLPGSRASNIGFRLIRAL